MITSKSCEQQAVVSAPLPARIIEKGLASDRIVIDTIIHKHCNHLPLYRQSAMLERVTGLELSRATLDGWVLKVGQFAHADDGIGRPYIQANETPVEVQIQEGRGKNHQAYLWRYSRPRATVVFDFRLGRGREGPRQFLGKFKVCCRQTGMPPTIKSQDRRSCMRDAGRMRNDALPRRSSSTPQDAVATAIVARIDELFAIDGEARRQTLSLEARDILRQEQIATAAGVIRQQIEAARSTALPGGERAKASNYTLTLWDRLTRFLEHPALELSNNLAENSMRPVALGRKNWIHIGSAQAGPKIAAIRSVVESCRRLKLPARAERTSSAISKPCTCA